MTDLFLNALTEANESGWYLYALHQTDEEEMHFHPNTPHWRCLSRASVGPPRRQISRGEGLTADLAIDNALGNAPELEAETTICNTIHDPSARINLRALGLVKPKPKI